MKAQSTLYYKQMNDKNNQGTIADIEKWIQSDKIASSRALINRFRSEDKWPEDYLSWVGKDNRNNLYRDSEKFFRVMAALPHLWPKTFTFRPLTSDVEQLKEATISAIEIIHKKLVDYIDAPNTPKHPGGKPRPPESTGLYKRLLKVRLDGVLIKSLADLDNADQDSVVSIYNPVWYAARSEAIAVEYAKTQGIIYFAAQTISRVYPKLGVRFRFRIPSEVPDVIPGASGIYNVPMLEIGSLNKISPELSKPGKKVRSRRSRKARGL
jgi:hypothetical protein